MIEKITLRIFWVAMLSCAATALATVWLTSEGEPNEFTGKLIFTFFVIGFASFLIWGPLFVYRLREKISEK